jgi:hypothetical protein
VSPPPGVVADGPAGIRAEAVAHAGTLLDDFGVGIRGGRLVCAKRAARAATSSLAIAA